MSLRLATVHEITLPVILTPSRFAPLRIALSAAKGLTVNSARRKNLLFSDAKSRCFAEFILSGNTEILRFAQDDSEGLSMIQPVLRRTQPCYYPSELFSRQ